MLGGHVYGDCVTFQVQQQQGISVCTELMSGVLGVSQATQSEPPLPEVALPQQASVHRMPRDGSRPALPCAALPHTSP